MVWAPLRVPLARSGRAPWISKNMRSGSERWLYLNVKSEDTSMAMRVTSPNDQKRTAVTLPESAAVAHTPVITNTPAAKSVRRIPDLFLRGSENQSAILIDRLLQLRMFFFDGYCRVRCFRGVGLCRSSFRLDAGGLHLLRRLITLSHLIHVILSFRIGRCAFIPVHGFRTGVVSGQRQAV